MESEQYLQSIVSPLVSFPDEVQVLRTNDDRGVLLTMSLNKEDMGKVIGKQGDTARALRRLVRQFGASRNQHIAVKINEPEEA